MIRGTAGSYKTMHVFFIHINDPQIKWDGSGFMGSGCYSCSLTVTL